jgi:hypothetical protein
MKKSALVLALVLASILGALLFGCSGGGDGGGDAADGGMTTAEIREGGPEAAREQMKAKGKSKRSEMNHPGTEAEGE